MDTDIIRLIAEVLAGLQTPRSLGADVLGAATVPRDELALALVGSGWSDADAYEAALRSALSL